MGEESSYREFDGAIVCRIPDDSCIDQTELQRIVTYTMNTWQMNRGKEETYNNTKQGKLAEYALESYLKNKTDVRYISYDKFRKDDYKKHAPFDGLLYSINTNKTDLDTAIEDINIEISNNDAGQITEALRERLEAYYIFTLEIKSSQLREKDYQGVENVEPPRNQRDYENIIRNIKKWDFFVYPYYTRRSNTLSSFYQYAEYVRNREEYKRLGNQEFLKTLMIKEYRNASDIYTRLYFDYKSGEIFIPGYVTKEVFYHNPKIGKMPGGKSGMALYYMRSISEGKSFVEIDMDQNLWAYDRHSAYARLFACEKKKCPNCGSNLQICNAKARGTYSYRCFDCEKWFTVEEINE